MNRETKPMLPEDLASYIDQTLLKPEIKKNELEDFLANASRYPFASVCIPPYYVKTAARILQKTPLKISTVVGFPFGYQTSSCKILEAKEAFQNGAAEIDMVMNLSAFKSGEIEHVREEIAEIVSAAPGAIIKVIVETCYLTKEEKIAACIMVINSGAHFIKTSTGFGPGGATLEDIRLLSETAGERIRVKASGGIKFAAEVLTMIENGAQRIGTSNGSKIIEMHRSAISTKKFTSR